MSLEYKPSRREFLSLPLIIVADVVVLHKLVPAAIRGDIPVPNLSLDSSSSSIYPDSFVREIPTQQKPYIPPYVPQPPPVYERKINAPQEKEEHQPGLTFGKEEIIASPGAVISLTGFFKDLKLRYDRKVGKRNPNDKPTQ